MLNQPARLVFFWVLCVMIPILGLVGCGGSKSGPVEEPLRLALEDFAQFLKNLPTDNLPPPKDIAAFMPLEPMAPVAAEYLVNGELVYFWGANLADGGDRVIAHQKDIAANGGWVLLENGKVVRMTPETFEQAPKAK